MHALAFQEDQRAHLVALYHLLEQARDAGQNENGIHVHQGNPDAVRKVYIRRRGQRGHAQARTVDLHAACTIMAEHALMGGAMHLAGAAESSGNGLVCYIVMRGPDTTCTRPPVGQAIADANESVKPIMMPAMLVVSGRSHCVYEQQLNQDAARTPAWPTGNAARDHSDL